MDARVTVIVAHAAGALGPALGPALLPALDPAPGHVDHGTGGLLQRGIGTTDAAATARVGAVVAAVTSADVHEPAAAAAAVGTATAAMLAVVTTVAGAAEEVEVEAGAGAAVVIDAAVVTVVTDATIAVAVAVAVTVAVAVAVAVAVMVVRTGERRMGMATAAIGARVAVQRIRLVRRPTHGIC